jgi:adenylate cyclase class 2
MQEIEVKFNVRDLKGIEARLQALGATESQPRTLEVNLRFDLPTGLLQSEHRVLRLRRDRANLLTYKAPGQTVDGVRAREEIEFEVSDFAAAQSVLEALGYQVVFIYEKYRAVHELGGAHVTLDELPYGHFVEIEGRDAAHLRETAAALSLDWSTCVSAGYMALFEHVQKKLRLPFRDLTFGNFAGLAISPGDLGVTPSG